MRLALLGHRGHWGYVLRALPKLPEIELCAISGAGDSLPDMSETLKKFYPKPFRMYEDWRELLEKESPEMVCIDGPFELHAEMTVAALQKHCHVFCEKPIALTMEDLRRIEAAYHQCPAGTKLISMVGLRAEAPFLTAYYAVSSGAIGEVRMVNARKSYKLGERSPHFRTRATYGGTIPWVGSHALDWILWFSGARKFEKIEAFHSTAANRNHGDLEMCAEVIARMDNGVLAGASIDYFRPSAAPTHGDDRVRIAGTDGVIEVEKGEVRLINAAGEQILPLCPERGIFFDFVCSLTRGERPLVDAVQTIELTRACIAARDCADHNMLKTTQAEAQKQSNPRHQLGENL